APCGIKSFHVRVDAFAPWLESKALGDIGHGADTTAPKVTITAPVQGATTTSPLTLKVDATDDVGVISVAIKVGGTTKKTLTQAPYDAVLDLTPGAHTLEVTAQDATGNAASAHVDITVSNTSPYDGGPKLHDSATLPEGGTPGTFGSPCASTGDCDKDLVCRPTVEGAATMFCTQTCIVGFATCPEGSECETRGGEAICSKPTPQRPIEGGCSAAPRHPHVKDLSVLALFAIFFIALNRRRRRRG
ncbi:MAG: hypothetical protein KAI47_26915, partial [Deltaproteobacteria bacterium]|nr:hypothetical protein [Deltaproteobacteria bacterium]